MKEKNIQELAIRMGLITVEDMCQYTIAQLVVKIANKVNELVDEVWRFESDVQEIVKTQNENIQYLLGEGLHLEVGNIFDGWVQDGTFDTLLNQSALKSVNDRIDETNAQLSNKLDKGGEIVVSQINKNKGKLDQTYMTDEFLQQITGNAPINAIPAKESVVTSMLAPNSVTSDKLDASALAYTSEYFSIMSQLDTENCAVDYTTSNLVVENDSGVVSAGAYGAYYFKWYKGFKRGAKFSIKIPNVVVPDGAEIITRYRTADMNAYGPVKHKLKIIGNCAIITDLMFSEEEAYGIEVLFDNRKGVEEMYFTKPEVYSGPLPINTYSMKVNDIQEMLNKTNYIVGGNGDMTLTEMNEQKHPNCVELRAGDVSVVDKKFVIGNNKDKGYLFFFYEATGEFEAGKTISFLADIIEPCSGAKVEIRFTNETGAQVGTICSDQVVNERYVIGSVVIPTGTAQINVRIDNRGTSKELVLANLKLFQGNSDHIELPENVVNFNTGSVKLNLYPDPDCKTNKYFNYVYGSYVKAEVVPNGLKLSNSSTTSFQACGYEFKNTTTKSLLLSVEIGEVSDSMSSSDAIVVIFFKDGVELSRKTVTIRQSKTYTIDAEVPEGTNSVRLRFDIGAENNYVVSRINLSMEETKLTNLVSRSQVTDMIAEGGQGTGASGTYYVSPTGSDENDGSSKQPLATVDKALEKGANSIYLYGGVYEQTINLKKCVHKILSISRFEIDKEVTFIDADRVLCDEETLVSGYTKVYKAEVGKTLSSDNIWIFQDSISDESTLISDEERHPLQRGYKYRCHDTKIEKCTSITLGEALSEIEGNDKYKWYIEDGVLYFSRPSSVNPDNPICCSSGRKLFASPAGIELKVSGISTKYLAFNINSTLNSVIADCKVSNVCGPGAFVYNSALNCKFIRCEASRCFNGSNGDGFNGHCSNTGDIYSKQLTATFIDCWSHDNNDDGYSDHERAESTFIGGLFEYNKKGGVTPSYGAHITCYNVLSRQNYCGFNYVGNVAEAEGGKYGQMICYNCVAENNTHGGEKAGFNVNGTKNTIKLINCKSLNNHTGYKASNDTNTVEMIDCSSYQDVNTKGGSGTFIIKNTTIVV